MLTRRTLVHAAAVLPIASRLYAQDAVSGDIETVPFEVGSADFSGIWELNSGTITTLVADAPDLPKNAAGDGAKITFASAKDIDDYFVGRKGVGFIEWFNRDVAGKGTFKGKKIQGTDVKSNFDSYWNSYLTTEPLTSMQFLCYMAVHVNECSGNLVSTTESYGHKDHPGISYLFDKVILSTNGRSWSKASYNKNQNCLKLFNDDVFLDAHAKRPGEPVWPELIKTPNVIWQSFIFPKANYPTSGDPKITGMILHADFFKFRGRGVIQTTWRKNYEELVKFIKNYTGNESTLAKYKTQWEKISIEHACTTSTSADWDAIFKSKDILTFAVRIHAAKGGNYHKLSAVDRDLNGKAKGSIALMGDSIGGSGYGQRLKARIGDLIKAL